MRAIIRAAALTASLAAGAATAAGAAPAAREPSPLKDAAALGVDRRAAGEKAWAELESAAAFEKTSYGAEIKAENWTQLAKDFPVLNGVASRRAAEWAAYAAAVPRRERERKWPKAEPQAGVEGKAGIRWIKLPPGEFLLGDDPERDPYPSRRIARLKGFELSKTQITNAQYRACVKAGACGAARDFGAAFAGDDQPVVGVTWTQAAAFAKWAGGRLPSDTEWEYAARDAGKNQLYPWGDELPTCERLVMSDRSAGGFGCGRKATLPVCSRPKGNTDQGLCDMLGNAEEWVEDAYLEERRFRGRPWDEVDVHLFTAYRRGHYIPESQFDYLGFRIAR